MTTPTSVDDALLRFGLPASQAHRDEIRKMLDAEIQKEADDEGDQLLMHLLCAQLFTIGKIEDAEIIWQAKSCNFDTMIGIDVQLVCGAGLEETKAFFHTINSAEAQDALEYLQKCEASGDFERFPVERGLEVYRRFYGVA